MRVPRIFGLAVTLLRCPLDFDDVPALMGAKEINARAYAPTCVRGRRNGACATPKARPHLQYPTYHVFHNISTTPLHIMALHHSRIRWYNTSTSHSTPCCNPPTRSHVLHFHTCRVLYHTTSLRTVQHSHAYIQAFSPHSAQLRSCECEACAKGTRPGGLLQAHVI